MVPKLPIGILRSLAKFWLVGLGLGWRGGLGRDGQTQAQALAQYRGTRQPFNNFLVQRTAREEILRSLAKFWSVGLGLGVGASASGFDGQTQAQAPPQYRSSG